MFFRRTDYTKIEKIHFKAIKIVIKSDASYEELLLLSNKAQIHQRLTETYLQKHLLLTETLIKTRLSCHRILDLNMQNEPILSLSSPCSACYGTNF